MSKVFEVSSVVPTQKDIINETKNQYNNLKLQTNRYKFAKEVTDMLSDFAKLHQYDGSTDYKEAWNNWIKEEEVGNKLEDEKSRLIKMGMTDAFHPLFSDFTGMSQGLSISEIIHKTFVEVNEEGTEAAAATAVFMIEKSARVSVEFKADRPFVYILKDNESNSILFIGAIINP